MAAEALLKALKHVWLTLEPLNAPMALMGGLALAAWSYVRATRDVDLLIGASEAEFDVIVSTLTSAGFRLKHDPAKRALGSLQILQFLYEPHESYVDLQVDLLLGQSAYHRAALARRVPTRLSALELDVFVLACEDLILHKLQAGRLLDRADAAMLVRVNRSSLDLGYLLGWTKRLSLDGEFAQIWEEAFPDEPSPLTGGPGKPA